MEAGFTQQEASEEFFVQRQTISAWENAHSQPTTAQLVMVGLIYGVSIDYILFGTRMVPAEQVDAIKRASGPEQQRLEFQDSSGSD